MHDGHSSVSHRYRFDAEASHDLRPSGCGTASLPIEHLKSIRLGPDGCRDNKNRYSSSGRLRRDTKLAKGNDGNYLQHGIETEAATRLAGRDNGGRLHIALCHGMAPFEPFESFKKGYSSSCAEHLERAIDAATQPALEREPAVVTAYRRTRASKERYPNSGELIRALVGTDKLSGGIAETDAGKCDELKKAWAGSGVSIACNSWRDEIETGGVLACPDDLQTPWLLTLDPYSFREHGRRDDGYVRNMDLPRLRDAIQMYIGSGQPGIAAIFAYAVAPSEIKKFWLFGDAVAIDTSRARQYSLAYKGEKLNLAIAICSGIRLGNEFPAEGIFKEVWF